jgi:hypothetical protein
MARESLLFLFGTLLFRQFFFEQRNSSTEFDVGEPKLGFYLCIGHNQASLHFALGDDRSPTKKNRFWGIFNYFDSKVCLTTCMFAARPGLTAFKEQSGGVKPKGGRKNRRHSCFAFISYSRKAYAVFFKFLNHIIGQGRGDFRQDVSKGFRCHLVVLLVGKFLLKGKMGYLLE